MRELSKNERVDHLAWLEEIQAFTAKLNQQVDMGELKDHHLVSGAKYIPISVVEMKLDTLFFGLWNSENFRWEQIENEIVAAIDVSVFHPFAQVWITRTGAMATQILVNHTNEAKVAAKKQNPSIKHAEALDIKQNKKPAALQMGMWSALKAECFKNGCLSLGKSLGRDVNRDDTAEYNKLLKGDGDHLELKAVREKLTKAIQACPNRRLKQTAIDNTTSMEARGPVGVEFYEAELKKLIVDEGDKK